MAIKNFSKIACLLLSLVLVLSIFSLGAFATEAVDSTADTTVETYMPEATESVADGSGDAAPAETGDAAADDTAAPADTAEVADDSDKADDTADTDGETETTGNTEKESKKLTTGEIVSIAITLVIIIVAVVYCIKNRQKVAKFFRECKSEVKKITWTPKNQVAKNTFVVIVVVIIAAIFIALLDLLFSTGIGLLGNL